ncbi:MAG: diadenylate cyclase CdaA [Clostridia bacterium]|nr:diadenylate cyclase CdaA [Clostridia bacterium]
MDRIFDTIYSGWNQVVFAISNFRFFDIIDILIIAFVIYKAIGFLRESRAGQLIKGIAILLAIYFIARWCELTTVSWALSKIVDSIIIAAAVIFQPEIRRILEKVGHTNFTGSRNISGDGVELSKCIENVSRAIAVMSEKHIGALIVFERKTQLGEIADTGTVIDAAASSSMLNNIFFPKSPLHDGALLIREGRLYAAGCILPLTQREDLSLQLGTRHRAAIGMTENSDAVVVVVSEETGTISIVVNGSITRNYSGVSAGAELNRLLLENSQAEKIGTVKKVVDKINIFKKTEGKEKDKK